MSAGLEREQELLEMFNEAAAEITKEDLEERESLVVGFSGGPDRRAGDLY